jgi:serine/threonine protein kinase
MPRDNNGEPSSAPLATDVTLLAPDTAAFEGRSEVGRPSRFAGDRPSLSDAVGTLTSDLARQAFSGDTDATINLSPDEQRSLKTRAVSLLGAEGLREGVVTLPEVSRDFYHTDGEIARGGLGKVSAARDQRLGRRVAIKELLDRPSASRDRFLREALITARLQHPSIVPVYEAGYWPDGAPFYAMKLVAGRTLSEIIDDAAGLDERLDYLASAIAVVDAIAYAHSRCIIHRDLKPSNIILGEYGETMVVDWGLAKDLRVSEERKLDPQEHHGSDLGLTMDGAIMGTPQYMAPEQAGASGRFE